MTVNNGDTAFMMLATAMVCLMTPGLEKCFVHDVTILYIYGYNYYAVDFWRIRTCIR